MVTCIYQRRLNNRLTECKSKDKCEYAHRYSAGLIKYCEKDRKMLEAHDRFQEESRRIVKGAIEQMLGEGI